MENTEHTLYFNKIAQNMTGQKADVQKTDTDRPQNGCPY